MIKSIITGFMITMAAAIYLTASGALGAFMLAISLLTILFFLRANHCVADMAHIVLAANTKFLLSAFAALLFTIVGNIIPLLNYSQ